MRNGIKIKEEIQVYNLLFALSMTLENVYNDGASIEYRTHTIQNYTIYISIDVNTVRISATI